MKENTSDHAATARAADLEDRALFEQLGPDAQDRISVRDLLNRLHRAGIRADDPRLRWPLSETQENFPDRTAADLQPRTLTFAQFCQLVRQCRGQLLRDLFRGELVIPDFAGFRTEIARLYEEARENREGRIATYIPQLARVDPERFGLSVCTIHGQRLAHGDTDVRFSLQSVSKPISYCIALDTHGEDKVHQHIGREPSGSGFNNLVLNSRDLPYNPMINAGAIMSCALIAPDKQMSERFEYVLNVWTRLSGGRRVGFSNSVYLSERQTADRNFALGYFMREHGAFPEGTNLIDTLEFYFQCCSIELDCDALSVVAATLANAGVCPLTGEQIFSAETVKDCLSLMLSCGMYDFSGEFAFTIGLPAKSGVSGGLMIVVPNLMGICIWSPRLDELGNSVRGIDFCKRLVARFNFHLFDSLVMAHTDRIDPRKGKPPWRMKEVINLCWAAAQGDLEEVQHLLGRGLDVNETDYDRRTALHLAAAEGHLEVVEYLLRRGADPTCQDRWHHTPHDDARRAGHAAVIKALADQALSAAEDKA